MKRLCIYILSWLFCLTASAADFCGEWSGNLSVGAMSLKLVLHIDKQGDAYACTLDSPMQGATGIPCTASAQDDKIAVGVPSIGAMFKGALNADATEMTGEFTQMEQSFPLTFKRVVKVAEAPKPYKETEVMIDADGGVKLAGTLTTPAGKGPFPAVVLITGSGAQDRDETIGDHKPFAIIADSLTRRGIAVLRFDDRGVGRSSVASGYETTADFASDAMAMLRALKGYEGIDSTRVGYIGHSEGGLIAIINATKGARFIVTLAAPGVKGRDLLMKQNEKVSGIYDPNGWKEETKEMLSAVYDAVETEESVTMLTTKLKTLMAEMPIGARNAQIVALTSPWYRYFIKFDPTDALKALGKAKNVAMMALNGELDAQVDAEQNLSAIKKYVPQAQIHRYPSLNHFFQPCESMAKSIDYVGNPVAISPEVISDIITFIHSVK